MVAIGVKYRASAAGTAIRGLYMRWAIYGLIFSFIPGIDMAAHIGGLTSGFAIGYVAGLPRAQVDSWKERFWQVASWACLLLTAVSFLKWYLWFGRGA